MTYLLGYVLTSIVVGVVIGIDAKCHLRESVSHPFAAGLIVGFLWPLLFAYLVCGIVVFSSRWLLEKTVLAIHALFGL